MGKRRQRQSANKINDDSQNHGDNRHPVQVNIHRSAFALSGLRLGGSLPLQQTLAREKATIRVRDHRIERNQRLMWQERESQQDVDI